MEVSTAFIFPYVECTPVPGFTNQPILEIQASLTDFQLLRRLEIASDNGNNFSSGFLTLGLASMTPGVGRFSRSELVDADGGDNGVLPSLKFVSEWSVLPSGTVTYFRRWTQGTEYITNPPPHTIIFPCGLGVPAGKSLVLLANQTNGSTGRIMAIGSVTLDFSA